MRTCAAFLLAIALHSVLRAEVKEVRIPQGAGGLGFLPLLEMEKYQLIEKHAKALGIDNLRVRWISVGGPAVVNDALLSGAADFTAAGPPAFLTLWDRTTTSLKIKGVAAMASMPMYLNTRVDSIKKLEDFTDKDKIAVTSIKVSIPALVMQMYAKSKYGPSQATRFDRYTVTMTHPDAVIALLSGSISAHFTSPPFYQRERKDGRIHTIMNSDEILGGSTTFTMLSTTSKFREQNPTVYRAVLQALEEANQRIVADRTAAAELFLSTTTQKGFLVREIVDVLSEKSSKFTTTPENIMKYANFMNEIGSIRNKPGSWKDLFFAEIQSAPGS
jgi:NitT/TauT family transport system substrate-binding protein